VVALREQGVSHRAIAQQVGIGHATLSRWLAQGTFPQQQPRPGKTSVDAHLPQLIQQWETGYYTAAHLQRELVANGYSHSYDSVYRQLVRILAAKQKRQYVRTPSQAEKNQEAPDPLAGPAVLAREAMFLFLHRPDELSTVLASLSGYPAH
jgi:transposase